MALPLNALFKLLQKTKAPQQAPLVPEANPKMKLSDDLIDKDQLDERRSKGDTRNYRQVGQSRLWFPVSDERVTLENAEFMDSQKSKLGDALEKDETALNQGLGKMLPGVQQELFDRDYLPIIQKNLTPPTQPVAVPPIFQRLGETVNAMSGRQAIPEVVQPKAPIESRDVASEEADQETEEEVTIPEATVSPEEEGFNLDVGTGTINTVANLQQAQDAARESRLQNRLLQGAELIGSSIARAKPIGQDILEANVKDSDNIVKNFMARADQEKNDPNSPQSKAFQQFAKKYGINIRGDFSAAMGEKLLPFMYRSFEAEEQREMRKEIAAEQTETKKQINAEKNEAKKEGEVYKFNKALGEDVDPNRPRTGIFGNIQKLINQSERLQGLIYNLKQGKFDESEVSNLTQYELKELAIGMSSLLGGSSAPAQSTIKGLTPDSLQAWVKRNLSWVANEPLGTDQQKFIERFAKTIKRETDINKQQLYKAILDKAFTTHRVYKDRYPEEFWETMSNRLNMPIENLKEYEKTRDLKHLMYGLEKEGDPQAIVGDKKREAIINMFMKNNPKITDRDQAIQILTKHGYLK